MTSRHKLSRFFVLLRFVVDCALIPCIIVTAYLLKFKLGWMFQHFFSLSVGEIYRNKQIEDYLHVMWLILLVWIFTFYFSGFYRRFTGLMPEIEELIVITKGVTLATVEIMALIFIDKSFPESRYVIGYAWIVGIGTLALSRLILHRIEQRFLRQGKGLTRALIIGADAMGQDLAERMVTVPGMGFYYAGTLDQTPPQECHFHLRQKFHFLGDPSDFQTIVKAHAIESIFITQTISPGLLDELSVYCNIHDIDLKWAPEIGFLMPGISTVEEFDGLLFVSCNLPKYGFKQALKRGFDTLLALLLLMLLSPLFLAIACLIKWTSPHGPVFFTQERTGKDGVPFGMFKFRTMIPDAEAQTGPVMVSEKQESRYIRHGNFLRKTSLDELPQLINVLLGTMSLVGPRPERPFFVEKFSKEIPHFELRHKVKGGITGWAQVNGRSVLTRKPAHKLRYDLYYIKNWSLLFDLKIMLKTMVIVFKREEAY